MTKTEPCIGLLFPGQGSHGLKMLNHVQNHERFPELSEPILKEIGVKSIETILSDPELINQNKTSSLLTVFVSVLMMDLWQKSEKSPTVSAAAGYSVGQWTAIYVAGGVTYPQLIEIVSKRSDFMNQAVEKRPSGMMAVIGLPEEVVENFCASLRKDGYFITISNYNCNRQYSLAGTLEAIEVALDKILDLSPKKAIKLPVSGGWHCGILKVAGDLFLDYLNNVSIHSFNIPVIDNVTGDFLPANEKYLKKTLAEQISRPVQWNLGIQRLIENGCNELIEIGPGRILTLFGLFINGSVRNRSFSMELDEK